MYDPALISTHLNRTHALNPSIIFSDIHASTSVVPRLALELSALAEWSNLLKNPSWGL